MFTNIKPLPSFAEAYVTEISEYIIAIMSLVNIWYYDWHCWGLRLNKRLSQKFSNPNKIAQTEKTVKVSKIVLLSSLPLIRFISNLEPSNEIF